MYQAARAHNPTSKEQSVTLTLEIQPPRISRTLGEWDEPAELVRVELDGQDITKTIWREAIPLAIVLESVAEQVGKYSPKLLSE